MTRTDQFIGLTEAAENYLEELKACCSHEEYRIQLLSEEETLTGIEIDGTHLRVYPLDDLRVNEYYDYIEKIQKIVWSGGPMYFTTLEVILKKKSGQSFTLLDEIFSWVQAPNLDTEFDKKKGYLNV